MSKVKKKHVQVPNVETVSKNSQLKVLDYLVYANIKRYADKNTLIATVSSDTIASKCGMTKAAVLASISKLEKAQMFQVIRSDKSSVKRSVNMYKFHQLDKFEMFTDEFLDLTTIPNKIKAY